MANTVIQLKHSTVQGNVPVSLANGEISINTRDGKLFYADPTGTIQEFSGFAGPAGLNGEIQFNDSGTLGANAGLTYSKTTRVLTVVGGAIVGGVNVAPQIQFSYNHANAAFNAANAATATDTTQNNSITAAFAAANNALNTNLTQNNSITAAFAQANAAYTRANNSLNANTGGTVTGTITATSFVTTGTYGDIQGANAIYANTFIANTGGYFQFADGSKQYTANSGAGGATVTFGTSPPASGNVTGDIWIDSNSGSEFIWFSDGDSYQWVELGPIGESVDLIPAFNQANSAFHQANAAYNQANTNATNITVIQGVNVTQNTNITNAQNKADSAFHQANAAFLAANNATDTYVRNHANSAFDQANAAYAQANTNASNITIIQGVNVTQNTNITAAQDKADNAFHQANAAYAQANTNAGNITAIQGVDNTQNTSISNLEAVNLTQNSNITAAQNKADSSFHQANAAYGQANTNAADIVVLQAVNVTQNTSISNIEGVNLTQNTNITNAQNTATAAYNRANNSLNANTGGTIGGDVSITGNLTVLGNTFSVSSSQIVANDTLFILGVGNYSADLLDIGFSAHYNAGVNAHTGLIRDSGTKEWQLFEGYTPEIGANNQININDSSFKIATLNANLHSQYIQLNGQNLQTYINGAYNTANAAFNSANNIDGINLTQNTSITNAQNSALSAFNQANASYAQGNTNAADIVVLQAVNVTQNTSISNLQGVDLTQNANITTAQTKADNAFHQANAAYGQANTNAGAITSIQAVNLTQNTSITNLEAVNITQNTNITALQGVNTSQNNEITYAENHANSAFNQANAAFNQANTSGLTLAVDAFTGTGACTTFTLSTTPTNKNYTFVTVDGVTQAKATYSLSGSNIVFTEAPPNTSNIEVAIFTSASASILAYVDAFTGTGACTTFTLTSTPANKNYAIVSVDGVVQHKSTYDLTGSNLIFTEAPVNSAAIDINYFVTVSGGFNAVTVAGNTTTSNLVVTGTSPGKIRTINFVIDGRGSVITAGSKGNLMIDYGGTIDSWTLLNSTTGNITVDISKTTYSTFGTFVSSGGTSPSTVMALKNQRVGVDWSGFTTVSANDILQFTVSGTPSNTTLTTVSLRINSTS